jgi:CO/xanthine dehydrogenase Mo-binding subunit
MTVMPDLALPKSLETTPELSQWLRFAGEGEVQISVGKVEIGQGIMTALVQIAADALDVGAARIMIVRPSTAGSPDEGVTAGSLSIQDCGLSVRHVCAEVRELFRTEAAARLGTMPADLTLDDGTFLGPGNAQISYWDLAGSVPLDRPAIAARFDVKRRHPSGDEDLARVDIADKLFGRACFIQDRRPEAVIHGRVVHPRRLGSRRSGTEDVAAIAGQGVRVVEDGSFLGLLSDDELKVERAAARLREKIAWQGGDELPDQRTLAEWLRQQPVESKTESTGVPGEPAQTLSRTFFKPYLAHASIGPSCALACWSENGGSPRLRVWTHSQSIYNLRADLAVVFDLPLDAIVVEHADGAGCYGHNPADDVALDAALLARACPETVVRVQWSREDEMSCGPFGPAMRVELEVDLDSQGEISDWRHVIWSNGHSMRPGRAPQSTLIAAGEITGGAPCPIAANLPAAAGGGSDRNAMPLYQFPSTTITNNRLMVMPLRTSSMRSLGAFANVFAIESMMDEIARARGEDPIAFRLRHLKDMRARRVIEAAVAMLGDLPVIEGEGQGRGFAFSRYKNTGAYCAVFADITCTDEIRVDRLAIAVDVGEVINRDGVINQVEGGGIQATSWALKEAVLLQPDGVASRGWGSYPILRFSEVPAVAVRIVDAGDAPPLGAGEASQGPTGAAIANAFFSAVGSRIATFPFTRDNLLATMEQAT